MARFQYYLLGVLLMIFCFDTSQALKDPKSTKLRLVSTVFRHGDRTMEPSRGETYPNDPHKNYNNYPFGEGQLTNLISDIIVKAGKRRAYELGKVLRTRYSSFLGDIYYQPNIYARSTSSVRTKMTLQLILAALYPPVKMQNWNQELAWQPVDLLYAPICQDGLLFPLLCPKYKQVYKAMLQTPEVRAKVARFNDLMKTMSFYAGSNITDMFSLFYLYHTFSTQSSLGLTLPNWSKSVFPHGELLDATILQYHLFSYNNELIRLSGGTLLYKLIGDMNGVINGTLTKRKINLLSAHDLTVAAMLKALDIFDNKSPVFTSGVIVELHETDGDYFVKVLHYLGIPSQMVEVAIPGCDLLCPYAEFVRLTSAVAATSDDPTCPIASVEPKC